MSTESSGPPGDLQVLDEIKAVELRPPASHCWQIPALGRRRAALPRYAIERAMTRQHAVDSGARGNRLGRALFVQGQGNGVGSVFAQYAVFAQSATHSKNVLFYLDWSAVPGSPRHQIRERHPVEASAAGALNPIGHRAHAHSSRPRHRVQTLSRSYRLNHLAPLLFERKFLTMTWSIKNAHTVPQLFSKLTLRCSTNAETRVSD